MFTTWVLRTLLFFELVLVITKMLPKVLVLFFFFPSPSLQAALVTLLYVMLQGLFTGQNNPLLHSTVQLDLHANTYIYRYVGHPHR